MQGVVEEQPKGEWVGGYCRDVNACSCCQTCVPPKPTVADHLPIPLFRHFLLLSQ